VHDLHARKAGGDLLPSTATTFVRRDRNRLRCALGSSGKRLGFIEEPSLVGAQVLRRGLLGGSTEKLAFEPPVLLFE
jgi:hypothetical protein